MDLEQKVTGKTAAMVRVMKIMTQGMKDAKGTSFMEDYTYNLVQEKKAFWKLICLRFARQYADERSALRAATQHGDREDPDKTCIHI